MNIVVVDLEMCKVTGSQKKSFGYKQEIIQIGAVMLDEAYQEISSFSTYVKPEYGSLDWFIQDLTGITNLNLKNAPSLLEALQIFTGWINHRDVMFYTWSDTDYSQLSREIRRKKLDTDAFSSYLCKEKWVDYQAVFDERFGLRSNTGLKTALDMVNIDLEGRQHDGLEDARNTARLISRLELDPNCDISEEYKKAKAEVASEPLSFSMAGLFAGINLSSLPA